jgi:hypothetical protein
MVFLLNFGRQLLIVWWSRKNRSVRLQQHTESHTKRSVVSCFVSCDCVDSKNTSCAATVPTTEAQGCPASTRACGRA